MVSSNNNYDSLSENAVEPANTNQLHGTGIDRGIPKGETSVPDASQAGHAASSHTSSTTSGNQQRQQQQQNQRLSGNPHDIICGRGLHIMSHYGNFKLHRIVHQYRQTYLKASRPEKAAITWHIVSEIKSTGTRFIRRAEDGTEDKWVEVDAETAYKKVSHALRRRYKKQGDIQNSHHPGSVQELPACHASTVINTASAADATTPLATLQQTKQMSCVPPNPMLQDRPMLPSYQTQQQQQHLPSHHLQSQSDPMMMAPPIQITPLQMTQQPIDAFGYNQVVSNPLFMHTFLSTMAALTHQPSNQQQGLTAQDSSAESSHWTLRNGDDGK